MIARWRSMKPKTLCQIFVSLRHPESIYMHFIASSIYSWCYVFCYFIQEYHYIVLILKNHYFECALMAICKRSRWASSLPFSLSLCVCVIVNWEWNSVALCAFLCVDVWWWGGICLSVLLVCCVWQTVSCTRKRGWNDSSAQNKHKLILTCLND